MNILNNVDGSAKWEQGTSVICSVTGPIETRRRTDEPTLAQVELVIRPAIGQATTRETLIKDRIYSVLAATVVRNLYPRMLLQIVIQILEQGEGTGYNVLKLAACLNAMCLALIDSRTPMTGLLQQSPLPLSTISSFCIPLENRCLSRRLHMLFRISWRTTRPRVC